MPTLIFHITHLNNLSSILQAGGLLATARLQQTKISYRDISYEQIQDRRAQKCVPCGAGGVLHDYVPFYFAPRSPMLYTIHRGNVAGCPEGQTSILHLVTTAEVIASANHSFAFTDGHAVVDYSEFYDSLTDLKEVDWDIMQDRYWSDTDEDGDRKRRRQAEFLVHDFLPWQLIHEIGVINAQVQAQVQEILQAANVTTLVRIHRDWYYS